MKAFQNLRQRNDRHLAEQKITITGIKLIRVRSKTAFCVVKVNFRIVNRKIEETE